MRIAYNEATCKVRSSLEQDLQLCREHGISAIELRFDMIDRYLIEHTDEELQELVSNSGVRPITLNAIFNINFLSDTERASISEQMQRACRIGKLLNVDCVIVLPSDCNAENKYSWEEIREDSVRNLRWMAETAAPSQMRIAFEPIGSADRCVRGIRQGWEIVREVNESRVGLALDAYNLFMLNELRDLDDLADVDPEKVFIVHLDDADASITYDRLGTFDRKLPGDGSIDLNVFVRKFEEIGYKGYYSIEILNLEYWDREPRELFGEALEKTSRIIAGLKGYEKDED